MAAGAALWHLPVAQPVGGLPALGPVPAAVAPQAVQRPHPKAALRPHHLPQRSREHQGSHLRLQCPPVGVRQDPPVAITLTARRGQRGAPAQA